MANVEENRQQLRAIASSEESKNGEYTEGSRKKMTKEETFTILSKKEMDTSAGGDGAR